MEGLRYNTGKLRYDLLEPTAIKELVKVFTKGAEKYSDRNWENGMAWTKMIASLKRHLAAFESGEDFDPESELSHMGHVAWNALGLVTFMRTHPELDDRAHHYLKPKKIGLDIDGVLADFNAGINARLGRDGHEPCDWQDPQLVKEFGLVKQDPGFWLGLKPLVAPKDIPFEPHAYITSRSIDVDVTKQWLDANGFAHAPIYCIGVGESKVKVAKESGVEYFIDDYYRNFIELNAAGICTFLLTRSYNCRYNVGYKRINDFTDFKERFL